MLRQGQAQNGRLIVGGAATAESVFATVRHRTVRTKGSLSQKTAKLKVFTRVRAASKTWRRLNGTNHLPSVIEGVKFTDGVALRQATQNRAA
ncbi:hypothetical protein PARHAE_03338 [Paracoccus haematequi]|uniref:Uncharacterized protein n=1 Tax=Paracoccus haematequi TaxID=2491866 RepID=A0A447IRL9_9RHOB|nr:hypothetical protein PARHAE_03338 [Paracoccus haematequi]